MQTRPGPSSILSVDAYHTANHKFCVGYFIQHNVKIKESESNSANCLNGLHAGAGLVF